MFGSPQNEVQETGRMLVVAACSLAVAAAPFAWADTPQTDLVVHASGFAHERGRAVANLFRTGDDVLGKPAVRVTATIHAGKATLVFARLPYADYAVTVFHDENGNGELDHNFLHMPAEPLGFSNGFSLSLLSGLPSFEKLRFALGAEAKPVEITVK